RLRGVAGIRIDRDLLAAGHALDDVRLVVLVAEAGLDLVGPEVLRHGRRAEPSLEALVLDQAEAALLLIRDRVDVLDRVAARKTRVDRVLLLVERALRRHDPGRSEETAVAQGVVAAAQLLKTDEARIGAIDRVRAIVDRARVAARVLEVARDDRIRDVGHP